MKSYRLALKVTGLSETATVRPAKVTDSTVTFPAQSVGHHMSDTPYLGQAGHLLQKGLFD